MGWGISKFDFKDPARLPNKQDGRICEARHATVNTSVKNFMEPRFFAFVVITVMVAVAVAALAMARWTRHARQRLRHLNRLNGCSRCSAVEQFVQLATIEPDAPTSGAVINFDTLALCHH
jgi:hypothetical protein